MTLAAFTFQPTFTGNAFGDFLEGAPTALFFAVSSPDVAGSATQYSVFAQDDLSGLQPVDVELWVALAGVCRDSSWMAAIAANFDQRNNSIVVPDALAAYLAKQNIAELESGVSAVVQCLQSEQHGTALYEVCDGEPGWVAAELAEYV